MASNFRPRRSMLYIPGNIPRYLEKARELPVDALILDLEDSVLPDLKETARNNIVAAVNEGGYGKREVVVRVNSLKSPWGRGDIEALAKSPVDAILLPRMESRQDVLDCLAVLDAAGGADKPVMVRIESPLGVLHAEEICSASPRIVCVVIGTSDLTNELHARVMQERLPMLHSLSHCLLAARAFGLAVVDGIHTELKDMHAFEYACRLARDLGFDGKSLIHPYQIPYANDAFTPKQAHVDHARRIIAAYADANTAGRGVVMVDGRMVENVHVDEANRTLALYEMIQVK